MRFYPCAERSRRQIALQLAAISLRQHLYIIGTITYALNRSCCACSSELRSLGLEGLGITLSPGLKGRPRVLMRTK